MLCRRFALLFTVIVFYFTFLTTVFSVTIKLAVNFERQMVDNWSFAACSKMVCQYILGEEGLDVPVSQEEIYLRAKNKRESLGEREPFNVSFLDVYCGSTAILSKYCISKDLHVVNLRSVQLNGKSSSRPFIESQGLYHAIVNSDNIDKLAKRQSPMAYDTLSDENNVEFCLNESLIERKSPLIVQLKINPKYGVRLKAGYDDYTSYRGGFYPDVNNLMPSHFIVVSGIDTDRGILYIQDPITPDVEYTMTISQFLRLPYSLMWFE